MIVVVARGYFVTEVLDVCRCTSYGCAAVTAHARASLARHVWPPSAAPQLLHWY